MILRVLQFLFESILNKTERDLGSTLSPGCPTFFISREFDLMKSYRGKYIPTHSTDHVTEEENLPSYFPKIRYHARMDFGPQDRSAASNKKSWATEG